MKKLALLLCVIMLSSTMVYAKSNPKYDSELSKIRTVKNAQTSVINKEIKAIVTEMEALELNTTVSASEKTRRVNEYFSTVYKEPTNTFGITLEKIDNNQYNIIYDYYLDGDYPVLDFEKTADADIVNPATGNYNVLITILLVSVLCIAVYTYVDPKKSN